MENQKQFVSVQPIRAMTMQPNHTPNTKMIKEKWQTGAKFINDKNTIQSNIKGRDTSNDIYFNANI